MKQEWSPAWKSSTKPRKQRKYRFNAPLHVRHKFLSVHLSEDLRRETGRRSLPVRKGDEVLMMRGSRRGFKGVIESVDMKKARIYVDGVKVKKVDGSEVSQSISPSNVMLTKLHLDDKWRRGIIERKKGAKLPAKQTIKEEKDVKKQPEKATESIKKEEKPTKGQ